MRGRRGRNFEMLRRDFQRLSGVPIARTARADKTAAYVGKG